MKAKNYLMPGVKILLLLCFSVSISFAQPPGWDFTVTDNNHSIYFNTAAPWSAVVTLDGTSIQDGDYIGVFYIADDGVTEVCGGYGQWSSGACQFAAWGDEAGGVKDGFAVGEDFIFRVYDESTSTECTDILDVGFTIFGPWISGLTYVVNGNTNVDLLEAACGGSGPTATTWTGATDTDWFTAGNWDNGVPDATLDAIVPLETNEPLIDGGIAETNALEIQTGATVTINPEAGLTTNGDLTNDGTLYILSDGIGYAGTYINEGAIGGSGDFQFDRTMFCTGTLPGVANQTNWHYLSAPFDGFSTADLPDYFVNAWDQAAGMWEQYSLDPVAFPCTAYPATGLPTAEAWSINFDESYPDPDCPPLPTGTGLTIEFTGVAGDVHTGGYSANLGFGTDPYMEWNLVGNPYPSGLEMSTLGWGTNTVAGAAYWDGCSGNYVYWNPGLGTYIMSPTLGFFVETTAADVLTMANTDRAHSADWFWKSDASNLLTLQAAGEETSDLLHVFINEEATPEFDMVGDFHKLISTTEGLPQIYTTIGDEMLAINSLPETEIVPMGFTANGSGSYTIAAIETSEFGIVELEDKVTGQITDLLTGNYTFEYTNGDDPNRFNIHFKSTGIGDVEASQISIWSGDQKIFVQTPLSARGEIAVYNMMGQEVVRTDLEPGLSTIPMTDVNKAYVVKVFTDHSAVTGKVFIR